MSATAVFLGPSCPLAAARVALPDAAYFPSAVRGDVAAAVKAGFHTIVLIDGQLIYRYPPSPREVSEALRRGVRVVGAASLGALRAVELRGQGMIGVGWVYRNFRSGALQADDDLLSVLWPGDEQPATLPLVRLRYGLADQVRRGRVAPAAGDRFLCRLRALYFEQRTDSVVRALGRACCIAETALTALFDPRYDIKRLDALHSLRYTRDRL